MRELLFCNSLGLKYWSYFLKRQLLPHLFRTFPKLNGSCAHLLHQVIKWHANVVALRNDADQLRTVFFMNHLLCMIWITSHLKQCMRRREVLEIQAIRSNDPNDWRAFKNCRNSVNNEIKLTKQRYYKEAFYECVGNQRKTWGVINEFTSRKSKSSFVNEIKCEGVSIIDSP